MAFDVDSRKRILLTRPQEEALRTAEKLRAAGHEVLISPVLEMQAGGTLWPTGIVDGIIATSAAAFTLAQFSPEWPLPEARRLLRLFVVGDKTAAAAKACGFSGEASVAADAKDLAAAVVAAQSPPARLVYLAGHDRKSDLETICRDAGLEILAVEVYEARAAECLSDEAIDALRHGAVEAILHYSRRSAEIFLQLAEMVAIDTATVAHLAISADAAAPLQAAGLQNVLIAAEPKEHALLALLAHLPVDTANDDKVNGDESNGEAEPEAVAEEANPADAHLHQTNPPEATSLDDTEAGIKAVADALRELSALS